MDTARKSFEDQAFTYLPEIYASALRMTKQKENAEDLASEVYSRAWKSFEQFTPGTNLRAWLYKIFTNTYINHYRKNQRQPLMIELDKPLDHENDGHTASLYEQLADSHPAPGENPEQVLANRFLDRDLKQAIDSLPDEFKMVVLLADVQSFSYQEIADILSIPLGTVRSRLWRGRQLLQQVLWKHAVETGVINAQDQPPASRRAS